MKFGIFETVFDRSTLREQFCAVAGAGFSSVQFHYTSAGLEARPTTIEDQVVEQVRRDADEAGIRIAAVSGTFNMIHRDLAVREHGLASLEAIAASCEALGTSIVTLCTGTRSTVSQWTSHPDNVARNAEAARRLLDEMEHPRLKVILDPGNVIASNRERTPDRTLSDAFELLGESIVLAHAKDLSAAGEFCPAGTGVVPWTLYRSLLKGVGFEGDVIFHSLAEEDVPGVRSLLD